MIYLGGNQLSQDLRRASVYSIYTPRTTFISPENINLSIIKPQIKAFNFVLFYSFPVFLTGNTM